MKPTHEQEAVLDSPSMHKKVIAGAGTGKSTVLVEEVRRLLRLGVDSKSMVAITFTHKAGDHLKEKIERDIGYIGTIHSWCYVMLSKWGHRYTLADSEDLKAIISFVLKSSKISSACDHKKIRVSLESGKGCKAEMDQLGCQQVRDYMKQQGLIYVDWLLDILLAVARKHDRFRIMVRNAARTLLWDEFQDSNRAEAAIFKMIDPDRSFIIGDWRQAIYQFRGSSERHLIEYGDGDDLVSKHALTLNWRSEADIVAFGNIVHADRSTGLVAMRRSS